jgi:pimeloyl-ACP methyl ester carboxylesterase
MINVNIKEEFQTARDHLLLKLQIEFRSKNITINGPVRKVHYLELGQGDPLILIHGGGSNACEWINILKPLSQKFHLYVVDRPGCGLTDSMDYHGINVSESAVHFIKSFMDALSLSQASFLAQSMGGYFSISFAIRFPQMVENLVLIGAPAGLNKRIPLPLRLLGNKIINKILIKTVAEPSIKNLKSIHKQILVANIDALSDEYLNLMYLGQLLPGAQKGFISLLENLLTLSGWRKDLYIGDQLHLLRVPVYFIWGSKDAFEKPESGRSKAAAIKECRFEVVENAGHCPWLDQPEKCVEIIENILQKA